MEFIYFLFKRITETLNILGIIPGRGGDGDEFGEKIRAGDGGDDADHGGDGVSDINAGLHL